MSRYAKVDWSPGGSELIAVSLGVTAAADSSNVPNPGGTVAKDDLVQLATGMALFRDSNMIGARGLARVACFDKSGSLISVVSVDPNDPKLPKACTSYYTIAGDGPIVSVKGGTGLPDDWGAQLARATDNCLRRVAASKQTDGAGGGLVTPVLAPVVAAIIVGGAALAVVGGVAAWRWLDPELRRDVAQTQVAASQFSARLQALRETGTLPPPGPMETSVAKRIATLSSDESKRGLLLGVGIAGGSAAALGIGYAIKRAMR